MFAYRIKAFIIILLLRVLPIWAQEAADPASDPPSPTSIQALISRLRTEDEWQRESTLSEIRRALDPNPEPVVLEILKFLEDTKENQIQSRIAIRTLRAISSNPRSQKFCPRFANAAIGYISSTDEYLRSTSVTILGQCAGKDQAKRMSLLKTAFERERQPTTKAALLEIIVQILVETGAPIEAKQFLEQALSHDSSAEVYRTIFTSFCLPELTSYGGLKAALSALKDENLDVRLAAISAISSIFRFGLSDRSDRDYIRSQTKVISSELATALKDFSKPRAQYAAASALAYMGTLAASQVQTLKAVFIMSSSEMVQANCAKALGETGKAAQPVNEDFIAALGTERSPVKIAAIKALGKINKDAGKTGRINQQMARIISVLRKLLREGRETNIRTEIATALGAIGSPDSLQDLLEVIGDKKSSVELKNSTLDAIGQLGESAVTAEEEIRPLIKIQELKTSAISALINIGASSNDTVLAISEAIDNADIDLSYSNIFISYPQLGKKNPLVIESISKKLDNQDFRGEAAQMLRVLCEDLSKAVNDGELSADLMIQIISKLRDARDRVKNIRQTEANLEATDTLSSLEKLLDSTIKTIDDKLSSLWWKQTLKRPWFLALGVYTIALLLVYIFAPLWMLTLDQALEPFSFKIPWLGSEISLKKLLLLQHRTRVLDAWVKHHIDVARTNFGDRKTVRDREVHVSSPVIFEGKGKPEFASQDLREIFSQSQARILIWGEGGAGKTSLACLIAQWAMAKSQNERLAPHWMIPVLIEDELEPQADVKHQDALLAMIRGQLQTMVGSKEPISPRLFEHLLRQRRVLVIIDHLSEMNETMQKAVRPELPDFSINSLIVTARTENVLGTAHAKKITPMRIEGNRTASFMESYLSLQAKRDLFPDSEFFDACAHLSRMVGARNITVLLARLYADRLIKLKEGSGDEELPDNIPDLMLSYLNELNRTVSHGQLDEREIHTAVSSLAWRCLKTTFRPAPTARDEVLQALGTDGDKTLDYLEGRLRIVSTVGPARNQVRINLDPLAEYLAGIHLCEHDLRSEIGQKSFLKKARSVGGDPADIAGFLLAVHDCYRAYILKVKESDPFSTALLDLLQQAPARAA